MKQLRELQGGYPRRMNYLVNLQNEFLAVANSMFGKLNQDIVLSGCNVVNNGNGTVNISSGIVFVSGEVIRFDGAANIVSDSSKAFIKGAPATSESKIFADGNPKDVYTEVKAIIGNNTSITQIKVSTELYTLATYIRDVAAGYAVKGEIRDIYDFDGTFLDNFDSSGMGITARYNDWHLINGNAGTPDAQGRSRITAGRMVSDGVEYTYDNGNFGGSVKHQLTVQEMPNHSHQYEGSNGPGGGGDGSRKNVPTGKFSGSSGGDQPHNNMHPYLAVYSIIKLK